MEKGFYDGVAIGNAGSQKELSDTELFQFPAERLGGQQKDSGGLQR